MPPCRTAKATVYGTRLGPTSRRCEENHAMALLKSVNDPIYAELSAVIESGMGRFPGASLDDVELAAVLPLRRGRADRIIDPEAPEEQLFEDANSVHVQIFVDQRPRY